MNCNVDQNCVVIILWHMFVLPVERLYSLVHSFIHSFMYLFIHYSFSPSHDSPTAPSSSPSHDSPTAPSCSPSHDSPTAPSCSPSHGSPTAPSKAISPHIVISCFLSQFAVSSLFLNAISSCLRLPPLLPVTSILPSITRFRRQLLFLLL